MRFFNSGAHCPVVFYFGGFSFWPHVELTLWPIILISSSPGFTMLQRGEAARSQEDNDRYACSVSPCCFESLAESYQNCSRRSLDFGVLVVETACQFTMNRHYTRSRTINAGCVTRGRWMERLAWIVWTCVFAPCVTKKYQAMRAFASISGFRQHMKASHATDTLS